MTAHILEHVEKTASSRFADYIRSVIELTNLKRQIRAERNQLRTLTERELKDIGITREDAIKEASRGYDDVPRHRIACK
ncbi:MAG: DUF1127 domain-containing protein [Pseudomonadota bacterium]